MITLHLPGDLADKFRAPRELRLHASTIGEVVPALNSLYPGIDHWLTEANGAFRRHLSVFVGGYRLDGQEGPDTALPDGCEVWVMRAVSGG
jgi:molybdopterin converting factor small subunit